MFSMAGKGDGPRRRSAHLFAEPGVSDGEDEKRDRETDEQDVAHERSFRLVRGAGPAAGGNDGLVCTLAG
jgi:hypothetical protein